MATRKAEVDEWVGYRILLPYRDDVGVADDIRVRYLDIDEENRQMCKVYLGEVKMKISVVTIAYNEVANIEATMKSVLEQTYPDIEHIVQDGGSKDGSVDIIKRFDCNWVSERDDGLYDGMNKGLARCTGDYVIFCNAGDSFVSNDVIEKMVRAAEANGMPDLVFGDCASEINGELMVRKAHGPKFMPYGMPAAHESMMYKLALVRKIGLRYDTSYRISADYKFTYEFLNAAKTFARVDAPIIKFSEGGVSTANKWKGLAEACRARKEVSGLPLPKRLFIRLAQTAALLLSIYAAPLYRAIRLRSR